MSGTISAFTGWPFTSYAISFASCVKSAVCPFKTINVLTKAIESSVSYEARTLTFWYSNSGVPTL